MLLKFCLNGASTLGHRTRGKSAKIKWYPQKLFESNPLLTTLNDDPYEYELLSFVLGMWVFNKPVKFNYVIFILLNVR